RRAVPAFPRRRRRRCSATTLVDVERLQRPYHPRRATGVPRRRRATSTSRYRPRRASSRRATGKPNALDVERPGAPLLPSTSATILDERPGVPRRRRAIPGELHRPSSTSDLDERQRPRRRPASTSTYTLVVAEPLRRTPAHSAPGFQTTAKSPQTRASGLPCVCRSVRHHRLVNVAVIHLDS